MGSLVDELRAEIEGNNQSTMQRQQTATPSSLVDWLRHELGDDQPRQPAPPPSTSVGSVVSALGRGMAEGFTTELPRMAGQALQFVTPDVVKENVGDPGKALSDWAERKAKEWYGPEPAMSTIDKMVYEGTKMFAPSIIPAGVIGTGARAVLGVGKTVKMAKAAHALGKFAEAESLMAEANRAAELANRAAGIGGAVVFGLSQAQQTEDTANERADQLLAQGDYRGAAEARKAGQGIAPYLTGGIEAAGEYFGSKYLGKLFGLSEAEVAKRPGKELIKDFFKTLGVEVSTEMGQQAGEAAVEKYMAIRPEAEPLAEALDVIGPTVVMTLLTGGMGAAYRKATGTDQPARPAPRTDTPVEQDMAQANPAAGLQNNDPQADEQNKDILTKIAYGTAPVATTPRGEGAEELKAAMREGETPAETPNAPLKPEAIVDASPLLYRPPGDRWYTDQGAMPGEPGYLLDDGKAAIVEHHDENGKVLFESVLDGGQSIGVFETIDAAAKAAEAVVDQNTPAGETQPALPLTDETQTPPPADPKVVEFIHNKVAELGSVEKVDELYAQDSPLHNYAREYARALFSEAPGGNFQQPSNKIPEETPAVTSEAPPAEASASNKKPVSLDDYQLPEKGSPVPRIQDYAKWFRANMDMSKRSNQKMADDLDFLVDRLSLGYLPRRMANKLKGYRPWGDDRLDRLVDIHKAVRQALADTWGADKLGYTDGEYGKKRREEAKAEVEQHQAARERLTEREYRLLSMTNALAHYFNPEKKERPTTYGLARRLDTDVDTVREAIELANRFAGEGSLFVGPNGVIDGNMFDADGYDMQRIFKGVVEKRDILNRRKAPMRTSPAMAPATAATPAAPAIPTQIQRSNPEGRTITVNEPKRTRYYQDLKGIKAAAEKLGDKFPHGTMVAINAQIRNLENGAGNLEVIKTIWEEAHAEMVKATMPAKETPAKAPAPAAVPTAEDLANGAVSADAIDDIMADVFDQPKKRPILKERKEAKAKPAPKPSEEIVVDNQGDRPIVKADIKPNPAPDWDYGVASIDEYSDQGAIAKAKFHKDAVSYLAKVAKLLGGKSANAKKKTGVNASYSGIAGSGDIYLKWELPNGKKLDLHLGGTALANSPSTPTSKSGIALVMNVDNGPNQWLNPNQSSEELAQGIADRTGIELKAKRPILKERREAKKAAKKSAKKLAKKIGFEAIEGVQEAMKGLAELFGDPNKLGSGLAFDEDTYAKAKPHFEKALAHAIEAGRTLKELVQYIFDAWGHPIRPYLEKFLKDKAKGTTVEGKEGSKNEPVSGENEVPADEGLPRDDQGVEGAPGPAGQGDQGGLEAVDGVRPGAEGQGDTAGSAAGAGEQPAGPDGRTGRGEPGREPVSASDGVVPGEGGPAAEGPGSHESQLAPEDRNHVIAPDDVIAPPGVEGKITANIKAIRLLKELEAADRNPTPEEKKVLAQYVGWGAFSQKVFNQDYHRYLSKDSHIKPEDYFWGQEALDKYTKWAEKYGKHLHPALGGMMTEEEWKSAAASTINAHYTSREVIGNMWSLAQRLGFKGGTVLEPAAGVGHFFGLMPQELAGKSALFGVEKDTLSGNILKRLYPQAAVEVQPFEKTKSILDNSIDLTITNVPFGKVSITDKRHPDYDGWKLHNYFLARSLDATKPGGIVMAITSAWSMDAKSNGNVRQYLANKADLIGAMRLPNTAFKGNAGTEVVTDVLVLRKKDSNAASIGHDFRVVDYLDSKEFRDAQAALDSAGKTLEKVKSSRPKEPKKGRLKAYRKAYEEAKKAFDEAMKAYRGSYAINEYYLRNPEMVLGKNAMTGTMYASETYTVEPTGNIAEQMAQAVETFPENIAGEGSDVKNLQKVELAGMDAKEGTLTLKDGKLKLIENGRLVEPTYVGSNGKEMKLNAAQLNRAKQYLALRDLSAEAITAMGQEETTDEQVADYQRRLNKAYDAFVKKHGTFNGTPGNSYLGKLDNDFALVDALEVQVGEGENTKYVKAPIFTQRTVFPFKEPDKADTIEDAVNLSMIYRGEISVPYLSELLGVNDFAAIKKEIVDKGLGFINPDTGGVEQRDLYLSGNVKKKLNRAKAAAETDPAYAPNVKALEKVIPEDLDIEFISYRLGATWIPAGAVKAFMKEVIDVDAKVKYVESNGVSRWHVEAEGGHGGVKNKETYASSDMTAVELIDHALNLRQPKVMVEETIDGRKHRYEDKDASKEARLKIAEISDEFVMWSKGHETWGPALADKYNEEKNGTVLRKHSAPNIDVYPGANPVNADGGPLRLKEHQKIAVSRALQESVLLAYGVGTGKTFILITAAMEMKRIGTARKPVIVAHNSTIDQYRNSFKLLYPSAKVLIPDDKARDAKQRKKLLISMATGNWDTIVLPQSFFDGIANDPARERAFVDEQIAQIEDAIAEAEAEEGANSFTVKDLETLKENRIQRLERLLDRRQDEVLTFEQMGIDALLVDEVHAYKRSEFYTKLNRVKGIDNGSSQRSTSLILKSEFVRGKTGGKNIVTATGTPISNTLAELWTMLRYVRPELLADYGVSMFDNFAGTFGVIDEDTEQTASGFKDVERFKRYTNGPELLSMFFSGADVRLTKDADLKLPGIRGGKPTMLVSEKSPELTEYIKDIIDRWKAWEDLPGREKRKTRHVPVVLYGLAKKASLDLRLVDPDYYRFDPKGKVANCVRETKRIYDESAGIKGTQIIFCDLIRDNAKAPRFNLHDDIRDRLIQAGIPEKEVAIFSPMSEAKEAALKQQIRDGSVRVVIGTTERLGIGVDIANTVVAGHDLSVPDRPMDLEQRHGRFIRQSNKNAEVESLQYATKDTLDAVMFQRLATKQKGADQVLTGDIDGRDFEDPYSAEQANFIEFAAAASGKAGTLLFERSGLTSKLAKYRIAEQAHIRKISNARKQANQIPEQIDRQEAALVDAEAFKAYVEQAFPGMKLEDLTLDGETKPRKEVYDELTRRIERQIAAWEEEFIGKPMGDFKKNAPHNAHGPYLSREFDLYAGDIRIHLVADGLTNYDSREKPSTPLAWGEVQEGWSDVVTVPKIKDLYMLKYWNGERVGWSSRVGLTNLAGGITRSVNEVLNDSRQAPGKIQEYIAKLQKDLAEFNAITKEKFKYREEMVEIQRRINEINTALTNLSSDELMGTAKTKVTATERKPGLFYPDQDFETIRALTLKDMKNGVMRLLLQEVNAGKYDLNDYKRHMDKVRETPKDILQGTLDWLRIDDYELSNKGKKALARLMQTAQRQIDQAMLVATIGEPLAQGIPPELNEDLPVEFPEGVTLFAKGKTFDPRRSMNGMGVGNVQRSIDLVTQALRFAGMGQEAIDRIKLEFKSVIDLRGKDVEATVNQWAASGKDASAILGATTMDGYRALMELSLEQDLRTMEHTAYHEGFHVMAKWVLPQAEYDRLMKFYKGNEEMAAEAFADFVAGVKSQGRRPVGLIRRTFIKIKKLIQHLGNLLRGNGFTTPEDIFQGLRSGKYGESVRDYIVSDQTETSIAMRQGPPPESDVYTAHLPQEPAKRIKAAKLEKEPLKERIKTWIQTAYATFKPGNMFPHLSAPSLAKANEILRNATEVSNYAKWKAAHEIAEILNPKDMSAAQYDLFSLRIILDDMLYDIEDKNGALYDWQERHGELPFGFKDVSEVRDSLDRISTSVNADEKVKAALARRAAYMRDLRRDLVNAKLLDASVLKDPRYFHHQVLEYANLKRSVGTGSKDFRVKKKGYQIHRVGSIKDYNSDYLQAEYEVIAQGVAQLEMKKNLDEIDAAYNIIGSLRGKASLANHMAVVGSRENWDRLQELKNRAAYLRGDGGYLDAATRRELKQINEEIWQLDPTMPFRQKIAMGLAKIDPGMDPDDLNFNLIARLAEQDDDSEETVGARTVLKAVSERKKFYQDTLGRHFHSWQTMMAQEKPLEGSAGYVDWVPKPGSAWYKTNTLNDKLIEQVLIGRKILTPEDLKQALVRGRDARWVIPAELAEALDGADFAHSPPENVIGQAGEGALNMWKRWILINPMRIVKYNLNNMSGDLDIVLAYNPQILKQAKQAAKDLWAFHYDKGMGTGLKKELDKAIRDGAIGAGMTVHDIPDISKHADFEKLMIAVRGEKKNAVSYIKQFWGGSKNFTTWRENLLRLAAYRHFKAELAAGKKVYGVSEQAKVDATEDIDRKAALLARELIGDYGNLSKGGQWLRKKMIPFYSWMEINAPRYWRLFKNLPLEGERGRQKWASAVMLKKGTVLTLKATMLYAAITAFNRLFWPDEEEEIGEAGRRQLHLILGRNSDGTIRSIRFQGALSDALSWVGLEDLPEDLRELSSGKKTVGDMAAEAVMATPNRLANAIRPDIKTPAEIIAGKTIYPDVAKPRVIRDKTEHVARMFSLDAAYRRMAGRPSKEKTILDKVLGDLGRTVTYTSDPGEAAYHDTRSMVFKYLEENNIERPSADPTNRSNALYYYKQALKYGDGEAAFKYLRKYAELGGTPRGMKISIDRANPLAAIPKKHRLRFMLQLQGEDRKTVKRAMSWYQQTYLRRR